MKNSEKFDVINCVKCMLVVFISQYILIYKRGIFALNSIATTLFSFDG